MDNYRKLDKVGEGTYGVVYRCLQLSSNKVCAMKKIRLDEEEEGVPSTALREVALLMELGQSTKPGAECIVKLLDVIHSDARLCLVFEFLDLDLKKYMDAASVAADQAFNAQAAQRANPLNPNLAGLIKPKTRARRGLAPDLVAKLTAQLLLGLAHLHSHRILHRDLKPQNLLIDRSGNLKIADFGLAREFSVPLRTYTHEIVTLWYRPPCVLLGARHYTTAVDVWSVGMIYAEMACGMPICPGDSEIDQLFKIFRLLGTPNATTWPGLSQMPDFKPTFPQWRPQSLPSVLPEMDDRALHLLSGMLVYEPGQRISAKSALLHPYFADAASRADPFLGAYNPSALMCAPGVRRTGDEKSFAPSEVASPGLMASPMH